MHRIPDMQHYLSTACTLATILLSYPASGVAASFAVASVRPSAAEVKFEHDGKTETSPGALTMRDVTVATCIKWAYGVQDSQIYGPSWLQSDHFDIMAKLDKPVGVDALKEMMQTLLADRFRLSFHRQSKEMRSYVMTTAKSGHKLHESAADTKPYRENSAVGTVARATTMAEFANFIAGPLQIPVVDMTGLAGRYDFNLDFTAYIPEGALVMKPDFDNTNGIIIAALQGELGLKLESRRETVEVMAIDHVEQPTAN